MKSSIPFSAPLGTISIFPGISCLPAGWVICDGSSITKASIPKGFAALAKALNQKSTGTAVTLPDLKNRFIIGAGKSKKSGIAGGPGNHNHNVAKKTKIFTTSSDGAHSHKYPYGSGASDWFTGNVTSGTGNRTYRAKNETTETSGDGVHTHEVSVTIPQFPTKEVSATGGTWLNRPKYAALCYMIKIGIE